MRFNIKTKDINSGFRLIKKDLIDTLIPLDYHVSPFVGFEFTIKAIYAGYKIKEVEILTIQRPFGQSKGLNLKTIPKIAFNTILKSGLKSFE